MTALPAVSPDYWIFLHDWSTTDFYKYCPNGIGMNYAQYREGRLKFSFEPGYIPPPNHDEVLHNEMHPIGFDYDAKSDALL